MDFEFDPKKSAYNKIKHDIDFIEAQQMWQSLVVSFQAKFLSEPRLLEIGLIGGKYWTAITTQRGQTKRIISARRARQEERQYYEKAISKKNE